MRSYVGIGSKVYEGIDFGPPNDSCDEGGPEIIRLHKRGNVSGYIVTGRMKGYGERKRLNKEGHVLLFLIMSPIRIGDIQN